MDNRKRKRDEEEFKEFLRWKKCREDRCITPATEDEEFLYEEYLDEECLDESIKEEEVFKKEEIQEDIVIIDEDDLEEDVKRLLGDPEENSPDLGQKVHTELAIRYNNILSNGLKKEDKISLLKKYPPIENMPKLMIPKLNPEAEAALPDAAVKRDQSIFEKQKVIAASVSCLASVLSNMIMEKSVEKSVIEKISDSIRLMCGWVHSETRLRRGLVLDKVNKELKTSLLKNEPKEFLFGNNLSESIKSARAVARAGQDLKQKPTSTYSYKHLNYRGPQSRQNMRSEGGRQPRNFQVKDRAADLRQAQARPSGQQYRSPKAVPQARRYPQQKRR